MVSPSLFFSSAFSGPEREADRKEKPHFAFYTVPCCLPTPLPACQGGQWSDNIVRKISEVLRSCLFWLRSLTTYKLLHLSSGREDSRGEEFRDLQTGREGRDSAAGIAPSAAGNTFTIRKHIPDDSLAHTLCRTNPLLSKIPEPKWFC